jgi:hypothetical protein
MNAFDGVPQVGFDDPPSTEDGASALQRHGGAASS